MIIITRNPEYCIKCDKCGKEVALPVPENAEYPHIPRMIDLDNLSQRYDFVRINMEVKDPDTGKYIHTHIHYCKECWVIMKEGMK